MGTSRKKASSRYSLDIQDGLVVAARVRKLMSAHVPPMTNLDLARHLDVYPTHLSAMLADKPPKPGNERRLQRWHLLRIAQFFGVTEADLLKGTKQPVPAEPLEDQPADLNRVSVLRAKLARISPELVRYVDRHQVRDEVIARLASSDYRSTDTSDEALARIVHDAEQDLRDTYGDDGWSGAKGSRAARKK